MCAFIELEASECDDLACRPRRRRQVVVVVVVVNVVVVIVSLLVSGLPIRCSDGSRLQLFTAEWPRTIVQKMCSKPKLRNRGIVHCYNKRTLKFLSQLHPILSPMYFAVNLCN